VLNRALRVHHERAERGEVCSFNRATRLGLSAHIHVPAVLNPRKQPPNNHRTTGWVSPTVNTYTVEKVKISRPCRQSNGDPSVI
jgi:hypothetical protein